MRKEDFFVVLAFHAHNVECGIFIRTLSKTYYKCYRAGIPYRNRYERFTINGKIKKPLWYLCKKKF